MKSFYGDIMGYFTYAGLYSDMIDKFPSGSTFVELGAFYGKSLAYLIEESDNRDKQFNIYSVDSFTFGDGIVSYQDLRSKFLSNMMHVSDRFTLIEELTVDAAQRFEDKSVDFLFIDASHDYDSVDADIRAWLPKIKEGGVIAGHDYENNWDGVDLAVNSIFKDRIDMKYVPQFCWFVQL